MLKSSTLVEEKFWKVVSFLLTQVQTIKIEKFKELLDLDDEEFKLYFTLFKDLGLRVELIGADLCYHAREDISLKLSPLEWLKLQAHFPLLEAVKEEAFHEDVASYFSKVERELAPFDLFSALSKFHLAKRDKQISILAKIHEAIGSSCLDLQLRSRQVKVIPIRVLKLQDQLQLLCEDLHLNTLDVYKIKNIKNLKTSRYTSTHYTSFEIDQFVKSLRTLDSVEERLILKIKNEESFEALPGEEYLRNEICVKNYRGEKIWAASIEPTQEIFTWILNLGEAVEVLSSQRFKKAFLEFCQEELKKLA